MNVVLLSGGIDSTLALALTLNHGDADTITVDYGQSHRREIEAAAAIADHYNVRNTVITISGLWFDSALTGLGDIPTGHAEQPDTTYVPGRNTMLIALAASRAESIGAQRIVIGCNKDDAAGYPDCRREYIEAFRDVLISGTVNHVWVKAPLLHMTKKEVIHTAKSIDVPLALTYSCYRGEPQACGRCGACEVMACI